MVLTKETHDILNKDIEYWPLLPSGYLIEDYVTEEVTLAVVEVQRCINTCNKSIVEFGPFDFGISNGDNVTEEVMLFIWWKHRLLRQWALKKYLLTSRFLLKSH